MNWDESLLIPLNLILSVIQHIQYVSTHLDIILTKFSDISHAIYSKFKTEIACNIQMWPDLKMSLQGGAAKLKMNVLGRLNFLFSMIPMPPPPRYLNEYEKEMGKPHRMTDMRFCGLKPLSVCRKFCPIISNFFEWNVKLCDCCSVWYNYNPLKHCGPCFNDSWAPEETHILQDLYDRFAFR